MPPLLSLGLCKYHSTQRTKNPLSTRIICRVGDGRELSNQNIHRIQYQPETLGEKGTWKRVTSADNRATEINSYLEELGKRVTQIYNDALNKNVIPDAEYFRDNLKPKEERKRLSFWEAWEAHMTVKKQKVQLETFKKFNAIKGHLKAFETDRKRIITFSEISKVFLEDFHLFLSSSRGLNDQTSGKNIRFLRGFLNWCNERDHLQTQAYKAYKVKGHTDSLKVILTDAELGRIRSFDFGSKDYLLNASKLLLLSCYTGLRFSDYSTIKEEHLKEYEGQYYLSKYQIKTGEEVQVPLSKETKSIVDQMIDGSIRVISNQKMNDYAKELCQLVGIDEPFEKVTHRGNVKESSKHPKHELVSTHTGRRTFATNLLTKGIPPEIVMKYTGHSSYASFAKYVNIPKHTQMEVVRRALLGDTMKVA